MRIGITLAVIGAVVAEFAGSQNGLGFLIQYASTQLDTALMFAALIVVSVLGLVFYYLVGLRGVPARPTVPAHHAHRRVSGFAPLQHPFRPPLRRPHPRRTVMHMKRKAVAAMALGASALLLAGCAATSGAAEKSASVDADHVSIQLDFQPRGHPLDLLHGRRARLLR